MPNVGFSFGWNASSGFEVDRSQYGRKNGSMLFNIMWGSTPIHGISMPSTYTYVSGDIPPRGISCYIDVHMGTPPGGTYA